MKNVREGFPPIADISATVLILGTMPGEESLRKNEYYGNPRNTFWKIMARLFEFAHNANYEERKGMLIKNKVALWDVMQSCERSGSLDAAINHETIIENDFVSFYRNHPNIRFLFFNGAKAEKEYFKRVMPRLSDEAKSIPYFRLPSTSPAMAQMSFDAKLMEWLNLKRKIQTSHAVNRQ